MLESKRKAIIFFLIALLLAGLSGFLVLKKVQALNSDLGTMVDVYVAKEEITSRTIITPENIKTDEIPKKYLKDEYITDVDDLINRVAIVPLSPGDTITKNILKEASSVTEEDNRLISLVNSDKVHFDEPLMPLDRVDLIVSHNFDGDPVTEVFMEDVKVAQTAKKDGKFTGVKLEIPFDIVPKLIHMQNYADSLRVVKANVGQAQDPEDEVNAKDDEEQNKKEQEEEIKKKQEEKEEKEKKAEEEKKKQEEKEKAKKDDKKK